MQGAQANPGQPHHVIADPLHHAADDPVAPFVNHDPENGAFVLVPDSPEFIRFDPLTIDHNAVGKFIECRPRWMSIQQDLVFLLEFVSGMRDPVRQLAIVRQQQQAGCRPVEPANGHDPFRYVDQIEYRPPAPLIAGSRDVSLRLVE